VKTTAKVATILAVICWSGICGLGSIEIGSLGPINTLPFDHTSVCPESRSWASSPTSTNHRWKWNSANFALTEFYEVAPALVTPSYLSSLYNVRWDSSVPPSLSEAGAMSEQTRERSLDELAGGLASGILSRRNVLYATGGYREVYERLQQNAGENGAE
jgi:hypothetical protein